MHPAHVAVERNTKTAAWQIQEPTKGFSLIFYQFCKDRIHR